MAVGLLLPFMSPQGALGQLDGRPVPLLCRGNSHSARRGLAKYVGRPRSIVLPCLRLSRYCDSFLGVGGSLSELFRVHKNYMFRAHKRGIGV